MLTLDPMQSLNIRQSVDFMLFLDPMSLNPFQSHNNRQFLNLIQQQAAFRYLQQPSVSRTTRKVKERRTIL